MTQPNATGKRSQPNNLASQRHAEATSSSIAYMTQHYSEKALADALAAVPLFSGATLKQRKTLSRLGKVQSWKEGREVVSEGSKGAAFFLLLAGSVDVIRGKKIIARLNEGDFFGEIALMSDAPRNASVTASSDGTAFTVSRTGLAGALKADPNLGMKLLAAMADRQAAR